MQKRNYRSCQVRTGVSQLDVERRHRSSSVSSINNAGCTLLECRSPWLGKERRLARIGPARDASGMHSRSCCDGQAPSMRQQSQSPQHLHTSLRLDWMHSPTKFPTQSTRLVRNPWRRKSWEPSVQSACYWRICSIPNQFVGQRRFVDPSSVPTTPLTPFSLFNVDSVMT